MTHGSGSFETIRLPQTNLKPNVTELLEIVVGNILFLTNIKKTKENFYDIEFIIPKNAKLKYP